MNASIRRLIFAIFVLISIVLAGAAGFHRLGAGRWDFGECVYMTIITVSTVGFAELHDMHSVPGARPLTVTLIVSGVGALAYVQGNLTALLVEGAIGLAFRRNRMKKAIQALSGHVIVAGAGSTGRHVIEELLATHTPFVVIDQDAAHLDRISHDVAGGKMLYICGDATDDHALIAAGIERARGLVAALTQDKDNLFVTLSARSINASARIVAKIVEDHAAPKMLRAGASGVVNPTAIGGRRMASELIRPEVTEFLDQMLRDKNKNLRIEEAIIPPGSNYIGMSIKETPIRRETRLLVVAVREPDRRFVYNPDPEHLVVAGASLIVMGEADAVIKLRRMIDDSVGAPPPPPPPPSSAAKSAG